MKIRNLMLMLAMASVALLTAATLTEAWNRDVAWPLMPTQNPHHRGGRNP